MRGSFGDEGVPLEKARFVLVPVPYEKTTTYAKGTAGGPAALLEASLQVELWDEELEQETFREGIHTAEPFVWEGDHAGMAPALARRYAELHGRGRVVAVLGGDYDELLCDASTPPLSGLVVASEQVGHEAARLLERLIGDSELRRRLGSHGPERAKALCDPRARLSDMARVLADAAREARSAEAAA